MNAKLKMILELEKERDTVRDKDVDPTHPTEDMQQCHDEHVEAINSNKLVYHHEDTLLLIKNLTDSLTEEEKIELDNLRK